MRESETGSAVTRVLAASRSDRAACALSSVVSDATTESFAASIGWLCDDLYHLPQNDAWCVPACMSILSPRICGRFVSAEAMARQWHQGKDQTFDFDTMYATFRDFCLTQRMSVEVEYNGTPQRKDWSWFTNLKRPTLLVFDHHALVCAGVCPSLRREGRPIRAYYTLDPGARGAGWMRFPQCGSIALDFAFATTAATNLPKV